MYLYLYQLILNLDSNKTIFAGEINDKAGQIISSPFFNDNDLTARCKAVVQLEVTTQYFNLWYLLIIFSNFFTKLP